MDVVTLTKVLRERMSDQGLRELCDLVEYRYDGLPPDFGVGGKLREFLLEMSRTGRLPQVCAVLREIRPDLQPVLDGGAEAYLNVARLSMLPPPGAADVMRNAEEAYIGVSCTDVAGRPDGVDARDYVRALLEGHPSALVVGDYGTGKSFLAQRLLLDYADACEQSGGLDGARLPVLLPLKVLSTLASTSVLQTLATRLRLLGYFSDAPHATERELVDSTRDALLAGRFVCILDGFDEIPLQGVRPDPVADLRDLLSSLAIGHNQVVVTTRSAILPGVLSSDFPERVPGLGVGYLAPWDPDVHWRRYVERCLACGIEFRSGAEEFTTLVLANPELRQLTTTPLYCHMLIETRDEVVDATNLNVARLYELYTRRYFASVRDRSPLHVRFPDLDREIAYKNDCLGATAVGMLKKRRIRLARTEILDNLKRYAQQYSDTALEAFTDLDILVYSLLVPHQDDMYSFSHKSFSEYYAAVEVSRGTDDLDDPSGLLATVALPKEILTFVGGILAGGHPAAEALDMAFGADAAGELLADWSVQPTLLRNLALLRLECTGSLAGVDLTGLDFRGHRFGTRDQPSVMSGVTLDRVDLEGAYLVKADMSKAKLRRAKLNRCELDGADLSESDLTGAYLDEPFMPRHPLRERDL